MTHLKIVWKTFTLFWNKIMSFYGYSEKIDGSIWNFPYTYIHHACMHVCVHTYIHACMHVVLLSGIVVVFHHWVGERLLKLFGNLVVLESIFGQYLHLSYLWSWELFGNVVVWCLLKLSYAETTHQKYLAPNYKNKLWRSY